MTSTEMVKYVGLLGVTLFFLLGVLIFLVTAYQGARGVLADRPHASGESLLTALSVPACVVVAAFGVYVYVKHFAALW